MNESKIQKIEIYNSKFNQFYFDYLSRQWPSCPHKFTEVECVSWPIVKFNIGIIVRTMQDKSLNSGNIEKIAYKLVDIKMAYAFLKTAVIDARRGSTLIVGNKEVEKLNPNTIALLQVNHHRVYLITVIIEMVLDLFQLIFLGKIKHDAKNKWKKIHEEIRTRIGDFMLPKEFEKLCLFKDYRTSELHHCSAIRGFISKSRWNHFQKEERILDKILERIVDEYK